MSMRNPGVQLEFDTTRAQYATEANTLTKRAITAEIFFNILKY